MKTIYKRQQQNFKQCIYEYKENNNKPKYNKTIMRQTVRLTESDLHRIIRESVNQILTEGQGWNTFKRAVKDVNSGDFDYDDYDKCMRAPEHKAERNNWINHGSIFGYDPNRDSYNENGFTEPTDSKFAQGRINHGRSGKLGRAAAYGATRAYIGGKRMLDKLRKK